MLSIKNKIHKTGYVTTLICSLFSIIALASCKNDNIEFSDYDYNTVYFARQYPIRTIVLGNDENADNTLDNNHRLEIYAAMGGVRDFSGKAIVNITIDNTLCDNLYYSDGTKVKPMPSSYYTLSDDKIVMDGNPYGSVQVQLTDAFFADPDAVNSTYVIPVRMTGVTGADSILSGKPKVTSASRTNPNDWDIAAKDYILYCVKFINPWSGIYLRRGLDITDGVTKIRHNATIEKDEVFTLTTTGYNTLAYPYSKGCNLELTFKNDNTCVVTSATDGVIVTGTGHFASHDAIKAWGNKDRDAIYLDYQVTKDGITTATKDTLVARDRGVIGLQNFSPVYKNN